MKLVTTLTFLIVAFFVISCASQKDDDKEDNVKFEEFKKKFKKRYNGTVGAMRFKRWKERKGLVDRHNRGTRKLFRLVDNHLSDLSEAEWQTNLFGVAVPNEFENYQEIIQEIPLPESQIEVNQTDVTNDRQVAPSLDLRNNPCMPPIKLQSPCGGCWAFIATTSVEYQTCLRTGSSSALNLSEQQLIDCSSRFGTKGCNGGFYTQAWDYILSVGGMTLNSGYPYKAAVGTCQFTKGSTRVTGRISKYIYLAKNETVILSALQRGPVTVSISANSNFILYSSGIFDDDTCKNGTVNHGVVLVGYGRANNTDYWIVRNSWGTDWGQNGYILMKRNVNICRISEFAFLATL